MTPQLRFPEFTDKWQVKKLGSFSKTFSGGTPTSTNPSYYNGNIPFIKSGEIAKNKTSQNISEEALKKSSAKMVESGDILYALYGATSGQVAISQMNGAINQAILCIRPDANRYFIYSKLAADKNTILETYLQGGQGNLSADIIKKLPIATPSRPEQEKIADFLTAVDERIAVGEKKLELLETYKRGVMQKIFSQQVRFKDDNGNPYLNWDYKEMNEIFNEITDKVGDKNIETFSITAGRGFVSQTEKFGKDISGMQNQRYTLLAEDDFAYNKGNSKTYSYGCVYKNSQGKEIAVPNVFISFRLKDKAMASGYYEQLFINHYLDKHLRKLISSGARMDGLLNVNKKDFFEIKVPVPSNEEQQKIATFLTALDDKITAEQSKLTKTHEWKKGLLQRMFV